MDAIIGSGSQILVFVGKKEKQSKEFLKQNGEAFLSDTRLLEQTGMQIFCG